MIQKLQQIYDTDRDTNHGEENNEIELESQEMRPSDLKLIYQRDKFGK